MDYNRMNECAGRYLFSLGSMVQKGKFSAAAIEVLVNTLKKVLLPTLGSPTIPHLRLVPILPMITIFSSLSSFFLGGIFTALRFCEGDLNEICQFLRHATRKLLALMTIQRNASAPKCSIRGCVEGFYANSHVKQILFIFSSPLIFIK